MKVLGANLGLRWSKGAKLAPQKVEEGTFGGSFGATLGVRWGKGADLAPKKVEKGIFEKRLRQRAPRDRTWRLILGPSLRQEGVKTAKLGPRWRQVGAKKGQRARRGGMGSDLETKSRILELVFHVENVYFLDIGAAKWRQVGDKILYAARDTPPASIFQGYRLSPKAIFGHFKKSVSRAVFGLFKMSVIRVIAF